MKVTSPVHVIRTVARTIPFLLEMNNPTMQTLQAYKLHDNEIDTYTVVLSNVDICIG